MNTALILAGGTGTRLGGDIPKQYIEAGGKPIISYCLETFFAHEKIDAVQVVADEMWHDYILKQISSTKFKGFSAPGATRQLSIYNGLCDLKKYSSDDDGVIIHDAARPLVSVEMITACLEALNEHDGALPVLPMKDTVYFSDDGKCVSKLVDRSKIYAGQAPEAFVLGKYFLANKSLFPEKILAVNGSTEPAIMAGMDIALIAGDENNFKITTKADFNHYESPYPDIVEIHKKESKIFDYQKEVLDINFNVSRQLELLALMNSIDEPKWENIPQAGYRYYYNNTWFGKGDADVLYYMMRILKPKKIIEVGSGFSTAVMLDTNNAYFQNSIEINSIEPNADRLKSLLKNDDNLKIQECNLQDIPLEFFSQLQENDILFIDSSHVSKIDSDVNYYLFEILPRLKKGVYIHFHDIFYPFIYPKNWIYEGRAYNEMYLLRAFLMNNDKYSMQFFGKMLMQKYPENLSNKLKVFGGSLWIKKVINSSV